MSTVGRNQLCPCGSGRKYKNCCLASAAPGRTTGAAHASLRLASQLLQSGQAGQAEQMYRQILQREPANAEATHFLGMCLVRTNRRDEGLAALRRSVLLAPANEIYWRNLGIVLLQFDELSEAETALRRAVAASRDSAPAHNYLAVALLRSGRFDEAVSAFERALALNPGDASVRNNFGYALLEHGELERACEQFRQALALVPRHAMAHNNLGNALRALGDMSLALASYRRAVAIEPGLPQARLNLGRALVDSGDPDAALEHLRAAVRLAPEASAAWQLLADVLAQRRFDVYTPEAEAELLQCFSREDTDPDSLARAAAHLLRADAGFRDALLRARNAADFQLDDSALRQLARPLVLAMLEHALIPDPGFENLISRVRRAALLAWKAGATGSHALLGDVLPAMAHQCFLGEYVHAEGGDETHGVEHLQADLELALAQGGQVGAADLSLFACYRPLQDLRGASVLPSHLSPIMQRLLLRQVTESAEEARIRRELPALTAVGNAVSRAVQGQYEERPYPRWMRAPATGGAYPLALRLRTLFPQWISATDVPPRPTILIAGCGTGRHVAIASMLNPGSRILAIDLSRASLAYAARRARELGLQNVEFAQADILELEALERRFDVIECAGVLHHMQDPAAGWRVLVDRLNPVGWMKVGLYSEIGRRHVVAAKALIAERGFDADVQGMRAARAAILALPAGDAARAVADSPDFYSLSGCRDLLFHEQERRYTLAEIEALLAALRLEFLGFEFESRTTLHEYRREYPRDAAAVSLANWSEFEARHPGTFAGMYQFWVAARR